MRVGPPLQPEQGKFDESVLDGLDLVDLTIRRWNTRRCRHTTPTSQGLTGGELPALEAPLWFNLLSVEKNPPENKSSAGFALFE